MEYKERMLRELSGLIERRTKLEIFLNNGLDTSNELGKKKAELMEKQRNLMYEYEEILLQRILLEIND